MAASDSLTSGRDAFSRRAWPEAFEALSAADGGGDLGTADLERLATAAYLIDRADAFEDALTRAHDRCVTSGDDIRAARCAFWLAFGLLPRGRHAQASGWLARASRHLEADDRDCPERGYLLLPAGLARIGAGDYRAAVELFERAAGIADRHDEHDLAALARQGQGRALLRLGDTDRALALFDEVMLSVLGGQTSPVVAGAVYCSVIAGCVEVLDVGRAGEWTEALARWCESQPGLLAYRGECRVRRAEILRWRGQWTDAAHEAGHVAEALTPGPVGSALYQLGELHRLQGDLAAAEDAYRRAGHAGHATHPGLALTWLASGRTGDARAAIARVAAESSTFRERCRVLPALVEILVAAGDLPSARTAADQLATLADDVGTPFLLAIRDEARGRVLLAGGDAEAAIAPLRDAAQGLRELGLPYEHARVRLLLGLACRRLGDAGSADLEVDAARAAFDALGARADLAALEAPATGRETSAGPAAVLTARETEILRYVADGLTNRAIARALGISEKTVARHLSNIFTKLDLPSRAAATAFAFRHGLV